MFNKLIVSNLLLTWIAATFAEDQPQITFFYEDLRCPPEIKDGKTVSYKCPDYTFKTTGCTFRDQKYKPGTTLNQSLFKESCRGDCICGDDGRLHCSDNDCYFYPQDNCKLKNTLETCCPYEQICKNDADLFKCKVDDVTYLEGALFYPKDKCMVCLCQEGFDGKLDAPFCRKRVCNEPLYHQQYMSDYCAVVYFNDVDRCCPTTWFCDENPTIIKLNPDADKTTDVKCHYMDKTIKYGYGFTGEAEAINLKKSIQCECVLPPFVSCKNV